MKIVQLVALFNKVVIIFLSCLSLTWASEDLGQLGKVYPVIERDMVEVIKERISEKQKSGELDTLHKTLQSKGKEFVRRPVGKKLPRAGAYRSFLVDPSYTLERDIKDADGNILFRKGYTFNPLEIKPLTKTLCFIDGDDKEQVEWLKQYCGKGVEFKNILVNGDYEKVAKDVGERMYFDQKAYLLTKFRIENLPAVVRQSGKYLYVEEYKY